MELKGIFICYLLVLDRRHHRESGVHRKQSRLACEMCDEEKMAWQLVGLMWILAYIYMLICLVLDVLDLRQRLLW